MEVRELNVLLPYNIKGLKLDGIKRTENGKWCIYYLNKFNAVAVSVENDCLETAVLEISKKLNEYQAVEQ